MTKISKDKIVIIFGFSGAGKSTTAKIVAKKYGLRLIHPSSILRNLLEGKRADIKNSHAGKGFWESLEGIRLFKNRLKEKRPLDMVSDQILLKEIKKGNVVMDSWSMPWLSKIGIKIYLKAALGKRAQRVSQRSKISYQEAVKTIQMRDEQTRKLFKKLYGFDIKKDFDVFDFSLDTTTLNTKQVADKVVKFLENKFHISE